MRGRGLCFKALAVLAAMLCGSPLVGAQSMSPAPAEPLFRRNDSGEPLPQQPPSPVLVRGRGVAAEARATSPRFAAPTTRAPEIDFYEVPGPARTNPNAPRGKGAAGTPVAPLPWATQTA